MQFESILNTGISILVFMNTVINASANVYVLCLGHVFYLIVLVARVADHPKIYKFTYIYIVFFSCGLVILFFLLFFGEIQVSDRVFTSKIGKKEVNFSSLQLLLSNLLSQILLSLKTLGFLFISKGENLSLKYTVKIVKPLQLNSSPNENRMETTV